MREVWRWTLPAGAAAAGAFFLVDAAFLAANLTKIADGGYVPLLLAAAIYGVMLVWHIARRRCLPGSKRPSCRSRPSWRKSPRAEFRACQVLRCFSLGPSATRRR